MEEIDWQLHHNWRIKLPERSKRQLKSIVFRRFEEQVKKLVSEYEDKQFLYTNQVIESLWMINMNFMAPQNVVIEDAKREYEIKMTEFYYEQEALAKQSAKQMIRDHFKAEYGQTFKVTYWQRIKDLSGFGGEITDVSHQLNLYPESLEDIPV